MSKKGFENKKAVSGNLVDSKTGEVLYFQYNPENIDDMNAAAWAGLQVHGVHHPQFQYAHGDGRTLKFVLKLFHTDQRDKKTVKEKCDWLRSCVYPDTSGGGIPHRPPHRFMFNLGKLFRGFPCIVTSVNIRYDKNFSPSIDPLYAEVDIELKEFRTKAIGYKEVRGGSA